MDKIFPTLFPMCYSISVGKKVGNKIGNKVENKKGLNARRQRIITEMRDNPNVTTSELHQILGISETAVENNLTFLKKMDMWKGLDQKRPLIGK